MASPEKLQIIETIKEDPKPYSIEAVTMPTQQQVTKPSVVTIKPTELPLNLLDDKPVVEVTNKPSQPVRRDSVPIPSASSKIISPTTIPTKELLKSQLEAAAKPKRRSIEIPRPTAITPPKPCPITPSTEINGRVFDFEDDDLSAKKLDSSIKRRRTQPRSRKSNEGLLLVCFLISLLYYHY